ncbi:MAG: OmpH family outer membrane protein [Verrucomicrobiota bacterium]
MNSFHAIATTLLALAMTASAAPRIALVRVNDIYNELPSTATFHQQLKKERDDIMKDQRAEQLRKAIGELQALQAQLADKSNPLNETTSRSLSRTFEIKRQEAHSLQQDFESFKAEQEKAINRKLVAGMRFALNRIVKVSQEISAKRGFDSVFDSSGNTNTGLPFVLFSKDSTDLTADVEAALKEAGTATPSEKPTEASPQKP